MGIGFLTSWIDLARVDLGETDLLRNSAGGVDDVSRCCIKPLINAAMDRQKLCLAIRSSTIIDRATVVSSLIALIRLQIFK